MDRGIVVAREALLLGRRFEGKERRRFSGGGDSNGLKKV
jgi:hypothetical protein